VHTVLIDLEATTELDVPSVDMLRELHADLRDRDIDLRLTRVHHQVRDQLVHSGLFDVLGADHVHLTTSEGILHTLSGHRTPEGGPGSRPRGDGQ
jgi:anti-anti-sigma regulatory factor